MAGRYFQRLAQRAGFFGARAVAGKRNVDPGTGDIAEVHHQTVAAAQVPDHPATAGTAATSAGIVPGRVDAAGVVPAEGRSPPATGPAAAATTRRERADALTPPSSDTRIEDGAVRSSGPVPEPKQPSSRPAAPVGHDEAGVSALPLPEPAPDHPAGSRAAVAEASRGELRALPMQTDIMETHTAETRATRPTPPLPTTLREDPIRGELPGPDDRRETATDSPAAPYPPPAPMPEPAFGETKDRQVEISIGNINVEVHQKQPSLTTIRPVTEPAQSTRRGTGGRSSDFRPARYYLRGI